MNNKLTMSIHSVVFRSRFSNYDSRMSLPIFSFNGTWDRRSSTFSYNYHPSVQINEVTLMGHTESVTGVTWSHKDQELVSVGYDKTLRLWDIENSTEKIQPVHHTGRLSSVAVDGGSKK